MGKNDYSLFTIRFGAPSRRNYPAISSPGLA
jgi:hypothetical protein